MLSYVYKKQDMGHGRIQVRGRVTIIAVCSHIMCVLKTVEVINNVASINSAVLKRFKMKRDL